MAMPQRDDLIQKIRQTDALLEYAVMHGDEAEAERLRAVLRELAALGDRAEVDSDPTARWGHRALPSGIGTCECRPVWNGDN